MNVNNEIIKLKIAEYLKNKYPEIGLKLNDEQILNFVEEYFENIIYANDVDGEIIGVAIYLKINKEAFELLQSGEIDINTEIGFLKLKSMEGNIFHIFCVATDDGRLILEGMTKLMKERNPEAISILNRRTGKFHLRRNKRWE